MDKFSIFISWSGERSKSFAKELSDWLPKVISDVEPWVSFKDITEPLWFNTLMEQLRDARFGIVCLTHDNLEKPWIQFEAGAMSKLLLAKNGSEEESYFVPLLIDDLELGNLPGALSHITTMNADKAGLSHLKDQLKKAMKDNFNVDDVDRLFEEKWSDIESVIIDIKARKSITEDDQINNLITKLNTALEWKEAHGLLQSLESSFQLFYGILEYKYTGNDRAFSRRAHKFWSDCSEMLDDLESFGKRVEHMEEKKWIEKLMVTREDIDLASSRTNYDIDRLIDESNKFAAQNKSALIKADNELRKECDNVNDLAGSLKIR